MSSEDVFGLYENTLSEEELYKLEVQKELILLRDEERTKKAKEEAKKILAKEKYEYLSKEENIFSEIDNMSKLMYYEEYNRDTFNIIQHLACKKKSQEVFKELPEEDKKEMFEKYTNKIEKTKRYININNSIRFLPQYLKDFLSLESDIHFTGRYSPFNIISDLLKEEYEKRTTKSEPEKIPSIDN
jgi:hypothetical protein